MNFPNFRGLWYTTKCSNSKQKGVSCQDSIFASQEAIEKFTSDEDTVYTCFYDLASTFDAVEFSVLLEELFNAGICGKSKIGTVGLSANKVGKSPVEFLQYSSRNSPGLYSLSLVV